MRDGLIGLCGKGAGARLFAVATGQAAPGETRFCGSLADGVVVRYESQRARLTVRDAVTGTLCWKRARLYIGSSGFTIASGVVYVGLPRRIPALDLRSGRQRWEFRLPKALRLGNTWLNTPPVPAKGTLYFVTHDGFVWAIR